MGGKEIRYWRCCSRFAREPPTPLSDGASLGSPGEGTRQPLSQRFSDKAADAIVAKPACSMCGCCMVIWILLGLIMPFFGYSEDGPKDWSVFDKEHTTYSDSIRLAEARADCKEAPDPCPLVSERARVNYNLLGFNIVYQATSDIFTPKHLQSMCEIERLFLGHPKYPEVCQLKPGAADRVRGENGTGTFEASDCVPQVSSIVSMFYGDSGADQEACAILPSSVVDAKKARFDAALKRPETFRMYGFFFGKDVMADGTYIGGSTVFTRSAFGIGYPLHGREDEENDLAGPLVSAEYLALFYEDFEARLVDFFGVEGSSLRSHYWKDWNHRGVEVYVGSNVLLNLEVDRTVNSDLMFALVSILFVWCYLTLHTGSFFVGSVSLWQIIMSIFLAYGIYSFVFRITYYRQLHSLLIFIILGIGADDVFVFSDAWRHSETIVKVQQRGNHPVAGPVAETDATSDRHPSVVKARLAHAYRHAMLAVANTTFTTGMAFVATAVSPIMPIQTMGIYAFCLVVLNYVLVITLTPCTFAVWHMYGINCPCNRRWMSSWWATEAKVINETMAGPELELEKSRQFAPMLIRRVLVPFLRHTAVSIVGMVVLGAWGIVNIVAASQLESPPEAFHFFADEHMFLKAFAKSQTDYAAAAESDYNNMRISFGVGSVDREAEPGIDLWRPHAFYGKATFDANFDLSTAASQQYLREFCGRLRAAPCSAEGCKPLGSLFQLGPDTVSCFIEDFDIWNGGAYYEGQEFLNRLKQFRRETTPATTISRRTDWSKTIGFINGDLKYVEVLAVMSLRFGQGNTIKEPVLGELMAFIESEKNRAPTSMKAILQMVPFDWEWMETNEGLVEGLYSGFAIGFPVAFIVVLVGTSNIILAGTAIVTVSFVVGNVLGYCKMTGWYLGPGECVAGIIVIGLSVDYTIHLGHTYLEGAHKGLETRLHRWEYSMYIMGVTVIAGAVTTLFAAFVMQFCAMTFFNQMSTLIILTITYSITYTMFFFMAALRLFGPEGMVGDIGYMIKIFRRPSEK